MSSLSGNRQQIVFAVSKKFLDIRGVSPGRKRVMSPSYAQHAAVSEQFSAVGHAVRVLYAAGMSMSPFSTETIRTPMRWRDCGKILWIKDGHYRCLGAIQALKTETSMICPTGKRITTMLRFRTVFFNHRGDFITQGCKVLRCSGGIFIQ